MSIEIRCHLRFATFAVLMAVVGACSRSTPTRPGAGGRGGQDSAGGAAGTTGSAGSTGVAGATAAAGATGMTGGAGMAGVAGTAGTTGGRAGGGTGAGSATGGSTGGAGAAGGHSSNGGNGDGSVVDAGAGGGSQDGPPGSCIRNIYGLYVLRTDGIPLFEPSANTEQVVLDAATAVPLTTVKEIHGGNLHGCAVLENGSVSCWQTNANGNTSGQLGNGTTTASAVLLRATPVLTAANTPLMNAIGFATGTYNYLVNGYSLNNTCVITSDHRLWCWGDLTWTVNGGTALHSAYAQAITTDGINPLAGVVQAAVSHSDACAIVQGSPNSLWCWGLNTSNELAQGDTVNRQYPVQVLGLAAPTKAVIADATFSSNAMCVLDGGAVRCWGNNTNGLTGINSTATLITSPTAVAIQAGATLTGVTDLEPGSGTIIALRTDGTLWDWGIGFNRFAANYGVTNVGAIAYGGGTGGNGPRFLTTDGVYHNGMTPISVNCGAL